MVRIDMSEYQERHTVSRLVGAPPGYVGFEEGGQLTEVVRRKPYSVVLFDEIEKAHGDVFNTLLQVLDDGRLTDAQERTVDFRNTIIIMTSNFGSQYLLEGVTDQGEIKEAARDQVTAELRRHFRIRLEVDQDARRLIAEQGFDPVYGARPLRRFISHDVETRVGRALLAGDVRDDAVVHVTAEDGELKVRRNARMRPLPPALAWIAEADDTTFTEVVEGAPPPVVADFWAPWCAPCLRISPALERIAADLAGRMKLVKINIDDAAGLSGRFDVRHVPTLMVFHRGEPVARLPAGAPADQIRDWVTEKVTENERRGTPRS
ncbi:AAA family ATPase [Actinomadura litoris]|uniref:AAA family ATPase n=1 Tax=Actinomadura litoris TaxID=2678616 RepID=UPI003FD75C54